jgi:hypothetical protein
MGVSLFVLFVFSSYFISVIFCEEENVINRDIVNAKYLKDHKVSLEPNKSLTCWQCAALPSTYIDNFLNTKYRTALIL